MFGHQSHDHAGAKPALSRDEFLDLIRQPYAQPTLAALLEERLGYCLRGAHEETEVRSMTGEAIDLDVLYDTILANAVFNSALHDAALRLRK